MHPTSGGNAARSAGILTVHGFDLDCEAVGAMRQNEAYLHFELAQGGKRKDFNQMQWKCFFGFFLTLQVSGEQIFRDLRREGNVQYGNSIFCIQHHTAPLRHKLSVFIFLVAALRKTLWHKNGQILKLKSESGDRTSSNLTHLDFSHHTGSREIRASGRTWQRRLKHPLLHRLSHSESDPTPDLWDGGRPVQQSPSWKWDSSSIFLINQTFKIQFPPRILNQSASEYPSRSSTAWRPGWSDNDTWLLPFCFNIWYLTAILDRFVIRSENRHIACGRTAGRSRSSRSCVSFQKWRRGYWDNPQTVLWAVSRRNYFLSRECVTVQKDEHDD